MPRQSAFLLSAVLFAACSTHHVSTPITPQWVVPNVLSPQEERDGFRLLFDGTTLNGWRDFKRTDTFGWDVQNGTIHHAGDGADLMTVGEYKDFELRLDWKIAPGGNSGIFYRATEEYPEIYWSGPEMQVLDDSGHADGRNRLTSAGSAYGLYAAPAGIVRSAGEWNQVRIVVRGHHVEHWMNGLKVVEYELGSPDWSAKVAASKFHEWPNYGKAPQGHIGVQVHGNEVWYRSVRIRVLH
jgi:hypothetical protein